MRRDLNKRDTTAAPAIGKIGNTCTSDGSRLTDPTLSKPECLLLLSNLVRYDYVLQASNKFAIFVWVPSQLQQKPGESS